MNISIIKKKINAIIHWVSIITLRRTLRVTQRPKISLECLKKSKILFISPHYDDESIAAGGTLFLHKKLGSDIHLYFITDSSANAGDTKVREMEMQMVRRELTANPPLLCGIPDGKACLFESTISINIANAIKRIRPDILFTPFPTDQHRDHQAASFAVGEALSMVLDNMEVWCYEVWSPLWPNTIVDITDVIEDKKRLIMNYGSQLLYRNYLAASIGLNQFRGLRFGVNYGEAYYKTSKKGFINMIKLLNRL